MNFLKKIFGGADKPTAESKEVNPENTRLIYLLNTWGQYQSAENYTAVLNEIERGNSFLIIPSVNDGKESRGWKTIETGSTLTLKSVFNVDGLQVLGAFSDKNALLEWIKEETEYTSMRTQDLIEFCKDHGIGRIVINSDQKNMFVIERNRENVKSTIIKEDTNVQVGTPLNPLSQQIIDKLVLNFKRVSTIEEAYQFVQKMNNEISIVLGIKMSIVSDDSRAALHNALNNALQHEKLDLPLDIMVLDTAHWLETVRGINNSLFYKK